jgi:hypothetical protein
MRVPLFDPFLFYEYILSLFHDLGWLILNSSRFWSPKPIGVLSGSA